jgi:tRNA A-37 threonylcarbamoyl transferase component Bud32
MSVEIITCAPVINTGELKTLGFLREHLEPLAGHHILLVDYHLPDYNSTLEIDILIINNQGVFLLEVKDWWGQIIGDSIYWQQVLFNRRHSSPLTSIDSKASAVHSTITEEHENFRRVSVVGFVVLVKGDNQLSLTEHPDRKKRVFTLNQRLIQALTGRDFLYSYQSMRLQPTNLSVIKDSLLHLKVDPKRNLVGNYEIIGELNSGDSYEAFEARHIDISNRRVRLKKYHIPIISSEQNLKEAVRLFKRNMEALTYVDTHPNIVRAYDFFKDPDADDTYYLALEMVDGRMLREVIDEQPLSLKQSARYLVPVIDALAYCHQQGIIHRNLTPYGIYITRNGQIKLGDFDFARVPAVGQTITKSGQILVNTKYTAPEELQSAPTADFRADFYAVGAVWYDMLFGRPVNEPIRLTLIKDSALPKTAQEFLLSLLHTQPANRPASINEIRAKLEEFAH